METRERERSERSPLLRAGAESGGETPGAEARERATRLADAADRAIQATLSEDSARFLAQNRQEGGE
jgi:hypothetical protein